MPTPMSDLVPYVAKILLYPIKSLDSVSVESATILSTGALQGDREFALFDAAGQFVNGKRQPRIHRLRSRIDLVAQTVTLWLEEDEPGTTFNLESDHHALETWLGDYFGFAVSVQQNQILGFPDDTDSPGPTIVSTATLAAIASWYPGMTVESVRRRFRANIELDGVPAFWEDQLFSTAGSNVNFQIGEVQFQGINPCQRCVVVTRDPQTGIAYPHFQKLFIEQRQKYLPDWTERSRFNHFFRLAINTRVPGAEVGKRFILGDLLKLENS